MKKFLLILVFLFALTKMSAQTTIKDNAYGTPTVTVGKPQPTVVTKQVVVTKPVVVKKTVVRKKYRHHHRHPKRVVVVKKE